MLRKLSLLLLLCAVTFRVFAQEYILKENISYVPNAEKDVYKKSRCMLDIYYPKNKKNFATVIWFHGGGLEGGEKSIPQELKNKGIAVIAANYRLSPRVKSPAYIEDAAEAVAWAFKHIDSLGGSADHIYVSGHSAGGYLALMVGLDKKYLASFGIDANRIRGLLPVSGQTNTHYTIRKERGLPMETPVVDALAPLNVIRKDISPTLLITGDKNLEMMARYEENAHLYAVLKGIGVKEVQLHEVQGFNHGNVYAPACYLIVDWIRKHSKQ
jgi:acetyl esterase/lipase